MRRVSIQVMPKKEVLDVQGRAIQSEFNKDFPEVLKIRSGKIYEVELREELSDAQVHEIAKSLCLAGLMNPLIEEFHVLPPVTESL